MRLDTTLIIAFFAVVIVIVIGLQAKKTVEAIEAKGSE